MKDHAGVIHLGVVDCQVNRENCVANCQGPASQIGPLFDVQLSYFSIVMKIRGMSPFMLLCTKQLW